MYNILLSVISLVVVTKSAGYAVRYAYKLAQGLKISGYMIGFLLIAVICALPETFISVTSAIDGVPSLGLGTLFGSNVADLTLIFGLVILFGGHNFKASGKIVKHDLLYILILSIPILLGLNGNYSRIDGIILIIAGIYFFRSMLNREPTKDIIGHRQFSVKYFLFFLVSLAVLLLASDFTVQNAISATRELNINPIFTGMFFIALGTTLPELFLSIRAVRENHDGLAIGDILGNVLTDAAIVVGIVALISPFSFNPRIVYITGFFMVIAAVFLFYLMKTEKPLNKKDALLLLIFYALFVFAEIGAGGYFHYAGD